VNVLVTGATGFLGLHLTKALVNKGHTVIGIVHDGHSGIERPLAHWVFADVADMSALERAISDYECNAVIHLAAITQVSVALSDPISTFETNVRGTWNVLEACRRQKIKRVIVASTDKVYGMSSPPYTESTRLRPNRPYETSKACADILAYTYASSYGMSIAVTRSVNIYGPGHLNWSTLIPGTIRRIVRGEKPVLRNGGRMRRSFLYVEDLVDGYLRLLDSEWVGAMCFGGGDPWSVRDVVNLIMRVMGKTVEVTETKEPQNEIQDQWSLFDLAEKELGWEPTCSLQTGLEKTIPWYLDYLSRKNT